MSKFEKGFHLVDKGTIQRLALVFTKAGDFQGAAIPMVYSEARNLEDAWRWFQSDLCHAVNAADTGERLMKEALERAALEPLSPVFVKNPEA